ncbi:MAG: nuclear transport factor 2 family protein [Proteobacteria bacterium]|nr:nuclear transport factor 2 family protein [Pseudomonadota bacterium]
MSDEQTAAVVDRLVQAYNVGDMDAFLGCFADGAKIFRGRDEVAFDGKEAIRAEYEQQFSKGYQNNPGERIVVGRHIAERERVTGGQGGGETDFLTIYTVEDGMIVRVDFLGAEVTAKS